MYDQTETTAAACLDPNNTMAGAVTAEENGFSHGTHHLQPNNFTTINDHQHLLHHDPTHNMMNPPNNNNPPNLDDSSMELDNLQNDHTHLGFFNNSSLPNCTNVDEIHNNNWVPTNNVSDQMGFPHGSYDNEAPNTTTNDLLTLLHLPKCSFPSSSTLLPPTPSIFFAKSLSSSSSSSAFGFLGELSPAMAENPSGSGSSTISYDPSTMSYDPLFHLNLPLHQPSPLLRDLMFQSLPQNGYAGIQTKGINGNSSSLFGGLDEGDNGNTFNGVNGIYHDADHHHHHHHHPNGIFEFGRGTNGLVEGKDVKCPKNFVTERDRRRNFNGKYQHLRSLVPNPTKGDRASIVADAIEYINELKREVNELKLLGEKKRISKERIKRLKTEDTTAAAAGVGGGEHHVDDPGLVKPDPDQVLNGSAASQLRSSWLQRKCKDTEVDVRIVDDEVTIKLVQRKKINCLLLVSMTLDDLQLDLRHVAGGHVGDYYSFLFNTKIYEGSSVYASAIANKLIEVVDRQYAAAAAAAATVIPPTHSF